MVLVIAGVADAGRLGAQSRAGTAAARPALATTLERLRWRHIGPAAFGGRIPALAVDPMNPSTIFVGAASGGVFRSTNRGTTWEPVFDESGGAQSIGALAIAPSDPQVVWVGTGEANNRQSSSWGDGVFRTRGGGRSWKRAGGNLPRAPVDDIVIHPRTRDVVLGTHDRGLIVLDDSRLLAEGDPEHRTASTITAPSLATMAYLARDVPSAGAREFAGENPPSGALLTQVLPEGAPATNGSSAHGGDSVTLTIRDASGRAVRQLRGLFASGWGTLESRILDLHGAVQSSTAGPTEARQRMLVAYREEMLRGVADLNAAIGELPTWRSLHSGAGTALRQVRPPAASP